MGHSSKITAPRSYFSQRNRISGITLLLKENNQPGFETHASGFLGRYSLGPDALYQSPSSSWALQDDPTDSPEQLFLGFPSVQLLSTVSHTSFQLPKVVANSCCHLLLSNLVSVSLIPQRHQLCTCLLLLIILTPLTNLVHHIMIPLFLLLLLFFLRGLKKHSSLFMVWIGPQLPSPHHWDMAHLCLHFSLCLTLHSRVIQLSWSLVSSIN